MKVEDFIINNFVDSAYCVGYRFTDKSLWEEDCAEYRLIKPSWRYWYADPIPYEIDGEKYIFMEQYDRVKEIGYIAVAKTKSNGKITRPRTIIRRNKHLSFPMIINYKGNYYLLPESSATGNIEIYRMGKNVYQWEHYFSVRMAKKIVDIVYEMNGDKILLLTGEEGTNPLHIKKQIIQLENLDDINKLVYSVGYVDEESSLKDRNGGNFFFIKDKKYYVTQESTETDYGMYILLNEVLEFDLNKIKTRLVERKTVDHIIVPNLNRFTCRKIGTHTYGKTGDLEVVDISITKLSLFPLWRRWRNIFS